jgi:hypothetical protein
MEDAARHRLYTDILFQKLLPILKDTATKAKTPAHTDRRFLRT